MRPVPSSHSPKTRRPLMLQGAKRTRPVVRTRFALPVRFAVTTYSLPFIDTAHTGVVTGRPSRRCVVSAMYRELLTTTFGIDPSCRSPRSCEHRDPEDDESRADADAPAGSPPLTTANDTPP